MEKIIYEPKGVCSVLIEIELDGDVISKVQYTGGCNGNLQGISSLCKGMKISQVIERLQGIRCGYKPTSCPDQLATCLVEYLKKKSEAKV